MGETRIAASHKSEMQMVCGRGSEMHTRIRGVWTRTRVKGGVAGVRGGGDGVGLWTYLRTPRVQYFTCQGTREILDPWCAQISTGRTVFWKLSNCVVVLEIVVESVSLID